MAHRSLSDHGVGRHRGRGRQLVHPIAVDDGEQRDADQTEGEQYETRPLGSPLAPLHLATLSPREHPVPRRESDTMVNLDDVARMAMTLPEVTVGARYGNRTWMVAGKAFGGSGPSARPT